MSQQIDNQIVKMQFDNASFERNAKESMSTLEKLKAALRFEKVDMSPLQKAFSEAEATATKAGFSIRDVWIKTASKIEDEVATKIVNASKKMLNALSWEGINDGFKEYELKMGSIQTIMAGTGESLATVNKYLDELNTYSDKTIYSFADMTNNIGKFTNAGIKLDDAVNAIKGIANEAAVSGANANEASRAMYNFSQALSAGYVKLIDWKSIENANMATKEFKETLLEMATAIGTAEKAEDGMYHILTLNNRNQPMAELVSGTKNFNDSLQQQWLTNEVLTKSLKVYATDVRELNEIEKDLYETELRNLGLSEEQIKRFEELGIKATNAASEIKTFTMLMDTLKEAIGSGWAMSWQIMIGDFDQAKALWTDVGNTLSAVIDGISEARNNFLREGLRSGWEKTLAGGGLEDVIPDAEKFKGILLDLAHNQGILNDKEFESIDSTEAFLKSLHNTEWMTGSLLREAVNDYTNILKSMTGEELSDAGFSDYDILKLEEFGTKLEETAGYADELANSMNDLGGRENVIKGLKNVFVSLSNVLKPIRESFNETFGTLDPNNLFELTRRFRQFTEELKVSDDAANTLKQSFTVMFKGIKTVINGISTTFKGLAKQVLPLLNLFDALFGIIGKGIAKLSGTGTVTKAADKFYEFGDKVSNKYLAAMQKLADFINKVADAIRGIPQSDKINKLGKSFNKAETNVKNFFKAFIEMPVVQEIIRDFNSSVDSIREKFDEAGESASKTLVKLKKKFKETFNLTNLNKALTKVYNKVKSFKSLVKDFTSRVKTFFVEVKNGEKISVSFKKNFGGIIEGLTKLKTIVEDFFEKLYSNFGQLDISSDLDKVAKAIHDFVKNITPEQITMLAVSTTFLIVALNLLKLSQALRGALEAFTGIGLAIKNVINSYVKKQKSVILQVAESITIVAAALWVLSTVPEDKMKNALKALLGITVAITALTAVLTVCGILMNKLGGGQSFVKLASGLVIATSALMVATVTLKMLENVSIDGVLPKLLTLAGIMSGLMILSAIMGRLNRFSKGSLTLIAVAGALLLASEALVQIGKIPGGQLETAMNAMLKMMIGLAAIVFAASRIGTFSAIGLVAIVFTINKLIPMLEKIVNYDYSAIETGLEKNVDVMKQLGGVITAIIAVGAFAGNRLKGAGMAILSVTIALGAMLGITKLCGMLKESELKKGKSFIFSMAIVIGALEICSVRAANSDKKSNGFKGFTRIVLAMGSLLLITKLASMMKAEDLKKGGLAVLGLGAILAALLTVASRASEGKGILKSVALMMTAVMLILGEVALLSAIPMESMRPALITVLSIMGALSLLALAFSKTNLAVEGDNVKKVQVAPLIVALVMIGVLGHFVSELADKVPGNVEAAAGSLIAVLVASMALVKVLERVTKSLDGVRLSKAQWVVMLESIGMVAVVGAILGGLTAVMGRYNLNGNDMIKIAGAITITLGALSVAMLALSKFKTDASIAKMATAVGLSIGALIVVGGAIAGLAALPVDSDKMIKSSLALAIGMIGICAPIAVLGAVGRLCKDVNPGNLKGVIAGAIGSVAVVAAAILVLSRFGNSDTMIKSATALAIGLAAIIPPIAVLGLIGKFCQGANFGTMVGVVAASVLALAGVAFVLYEFAKNMDMASIDVLNATIPALTAVMGMVTILMGAIALAGLTGVAGMTGGVVLLEALVGVGLIIAGVIVLGEKLGELGDRQETIMNGIDMLVKIIGKIGEMIGSFIGGIGTGISNSLPAIGDNLITFSEKMQTFSDNMAQVKPESLEIITKLAGALLALTGAELLSGLSNLFTIGPLFKEQNSNEASFESLGKGVAGFCEAVKDIPDDAVNRAAILADVVSKIAPLGGLSLGDLVSQMVFGEGSMEHFASGIKAFGEAIVPFCQAVKEVTDEDAAAAQRAANATTPMIELAQEIPKTGGWAQTIMGESDLKKFGESIAAFAGSMVELAKKLKELEETDPDYATKITNCANGVEPLVTLTTKIKAFGGKLQELITGDTSLDKFGETLPPFADGLLDFVKKVNSIRTADADYVTHIQDVATATGYLIDVSNGIEKIGGIFSKGENDLSLFGSNLSSFGTNLQTFDTNTKDIDVEHMDGIVDIVDELIDSAEDAKEVAKDSFKNFKTALTDLSNAPISTVATNLIDSKDGVIAAFKDLFDGVIDHLNERETPDTTDFKNYAISLVSGLRTQFVDSFKVFRAIFVGCLTGLKTALITILSIEEFRNHGRNIAQGLIDGMDERTDEVISAASSLAEKANNAFKTTLDIHSPSKVTYAFGRFYVEGFTNGINDYSSMAVSSTEEMSEEIIASANSMISQIKDVIEGNIDAQPTIRPVLDTSSVLDKAKAINKMFDSSDLQLAYRAAGSIDGDYNDKYYAEGEEGRPDNPKQISFNQYNYSPKSLDRYEIYRQTKNQISQLKGVL